MKFRKRRVKFLTIRRSQETTYKLVRGIIYLANYSQYKR